MNNDYPMGKTNERNNNMIKSNNNEYLIPSPYQEMKTAMLGTFNYGKNYETCKYLHTQCKACSTLNLMIHRKSLHKITVALSIEQQQPCKLYHWLAWLMAKLVETIKHCSWGNWRSKTAQTKTRSTWQINLMIVCQFGGSLSHRISQLLANAELQSEHPIVKWHEVTDW